MNYKKIAQTIFGLSTIGYGIYKIYKYISKKQPTKFVVKINNSIFDMEISDPLTDELIFLYNADAYKEKIKPIQFVTKNDLSKKFYRYFFLLQTCNDFNKTKVILSIKSEINTIFNFTTTQPNKNFFCHEIKITYNNNCKICTQNEITDYKNCECNTFNNKNINVLESVFYDNPIAMLKMLLLNEKIFVDINNDDVCNNVLINLSNKNGPKLNASIHYDFVLAEIKCGHITITKDLSNKKSLYTYHMQSPNFSKSFSSLTLNGNSF